MRILGIDLGSRRLGLAVSDELCLTARALTVLPRKSLPEVIERIEEICAEHSVSEIVLGHPLNMNGSRGEAARSAESFQEKLQEKTGRPVHLWDERLTTRAAEQVLLEADTGRSKRKKVKDKLAATFILESYLRYRKQG